MAGVVVIPGDFVTAPGDNVVVQVLLADGRVLERLVTLSPDVSTAVRVTPAQASGVRAVTVFGVPGLVQFTDRSYAKGALIWGGLATGALAAVAGSSSFDAALEEYETAIQAYNNTRTLQISGGGETGAEQAAVAARAEAEEAYGRLERSRTLHGVGLGVLLGVYAAAVADGFANHLGSPGLRIERTPGVALVPVFDRGPGVGFSVRL